MNKAMAIYPPITDQFSETIRITRVSKICDNMNLLPFVPLKIEFQV